MKNRRPTAGYMGKHTAIPGIIKYLEKKKRLPENGEWHPIVLQFLKTTTLPFRDRSNHASVIHNARLVQENFGPFKEFVKTIPKFVGS